MVMLWTEEICATQVLILQQESLHACSHEVTCDEQLLHFLSRLKWSGLLKWGVQTPDQVSSISVVWNTQADQNLELFPSEAEWPLFVSFTHLQVQTQAWCARKGWRGACKKSFIFNSSELTGSMAISLRHEEQFCLTITSQSQIKPKDVKHVSSSAANKSGFLYQI